MEVIAHQHFTTARDLLRALDPIDEDRWGRDVQRWAFRGQANAAWALIPTALRVAGGAPLARFLGQPGPALRNDLQIRNEYKVLKAFHFGADKAGLPMPEDSQGLRQRHFATATHKFPAPEVARGWPPTELLSSIACAQHYGVPTRLLDWTYTPQTAAWFAAQPVAAALRGRGNEDALKPDPNLVVWALQSFALYLDHGLQRYDQSRGPEPNPDRARIVLVKAPYAANANLSAQHGVFTLHRQLDDADAPVRRQPLDEALGEELAIASAEGYPDSPGRPASPRLRLWSSANAHLARPPLMWRFTLPHAEATELLRLLDLQGVSAATLFPGLEGVRRALEDRALWRAGDL